MMFSTFPRTVRAAGLAIMLAGVALGSAAWAEDAKPLSPIDEYKRAMERPVYLRGDYFKAALAAYQTDFAKVLAKKAERGEEFTSKIENFDIHIEINGESNYVVSFFPTVRGNAPEVWGGTARYVVDGKTFRVLETRYGK